MAFLDNTGLGTVWGRIKTVFGASLGQASDSASVTIKLNNGYSTQISSTAIGLADSTNSKAGLMSPTEKSKLAGIASGAEVNVQSDWNQTTTTADDYIKNKPSTMPPSSHTHGAINNDGTITVNTGVTVANGDRFVISRTGANGAIKATTLSFDGDTTNEYLSKKGEWVSLPSGVSPSSTTPAMDGTATVGTETTYARGDHIHPTDTSRASATHTHGNISNDGKIATNTEVEVGSNDRLVLIDTSDSNVLKASKFKFDGSTTTKALTPKGSFETFVQDASYVHTDNNYTTADKTKVGYVDTGKAVTTYVSEQIASAMTGAAKYKGAIGGVHGGLPTTGYKAGDYYVVGEAGTYAGQTCEVGDMIFCKQDFSGTASDSDWDIVQANITAMTTAEINEICV